MGTRREGREAGRRWRNEARWRRRFTDEGVSDKDSGEEWRERDLEWTYDRERSISLSSRRRRRVECNFSCWRVCERRVADPSTSAVLSVKAT